MLNGLAARFVAGRLPAGHTSSRETYWMIGNFQIAYQAAWMVG